MNKGIAPLFLIIIVVAVLGAGVGGYVLVSKQEQKSGPEIVTPTGSIPKIPEPMPSHNLTESELGITSEPEPEPVLTLPPPPPPTSTLVPTPPPVAPPPSPLPEPEPLVPSEVEGGPPHVEVFEEPPPVLPPTTPEVFTGEQIVGKRSKSGDLITNVPACTGQQYTTSPIGFDVLNDIVPLGSLNPPGHVLPTEHMYWHTIEFPSEQREPFYAPGDIWITLVRSEKSLDTNLPVLGDEYELHFSLCEDVHGYLYGINELESFILDVVADMPCLDNWVGNICAREAQLFVKSGTLIGHKKGIGTLGIDFGTYDERQSPPYANLDRYRYKSRYMACPLDYFSDNLRPLLNDKLLTYVNGNCGKVSYDIPGTLEGSWYHESVPLTEQGNYTQQLAFAHSADNPTTAVISVGGTFSKSATWLISEKTSGTINRPSKDVTPNGNVYCYYAKYEHWGEAIIVQMTSETEILIEELIDPPLSPYGTNLCERIEHTFVNPSTYRR